MRDLQKLVGQVKEIVLASAKFTKVDSFSIEEKEGESWNIVTSADVAVQDYIELLHGSRRENYSDNDKRLLWRLDQYDPLIELKPLSGFEKIVAHFYGVRTSLC